MILKHLLALKLLLTLYLRKGFGDLVACDIQAIRVFNYIFNCNKIS